MMRLILPLMRRCGCWDTVRGQRCLLPQGRCALRKFSCSRAVVSSCHPVRKKSEEDQISLQWASVLPFNRLAVPPCNEKESLFCLTMPLEHIDFHIIGY